MVTAASFVGHGNKMLPKCIVSLAQHNVTLTTCRTAASLLREEASVKCSAVLLLYFYIMRVHRIFSRGDKCLFACQECTEMLKTTSFAPGTCETMSVTGSRLQNAQHGDWSPLAPSQRRLRSATRSGSLGDCIQIIF